MTWGSEQESESETGLVVRREFRPSSAGSTRTAHVVRLSFVRRCIDWVRGRTAEDFGRVKEAGIQVAEGEGRMRHAEALRNEAEAAVQFAEAEVKLQEAEAKRIENEAARRALAERSPTEAEVGRAERIADAVERMERSMSAVRAKGGVVGFDLEELERLALPPSDPVASGRPT